MNLHKTSIRSWSWILYDMGNSAYGSIMVTAYFVLYFKSAIVKDVYLGDLLWGKMIGGSMFFLALVSPALGAIADRGKSRKKFLIGFTLLSILATAVLALSKTTNLTLSILLFCLSLIGYEAGITFYDSFLSSVSTEKTIGKISGLGFGLGYLGGILSIFLSYPFITSGASSEWSMAPLWIVVIQFSLLSVPGFYLLRERQDNAADREPLGTTVRHGFSNLWQTLRKLKYYPDLLKFLIAYLFFFDGIATVISFGGTFAKDTLGFGTKEIFLVFILSNLIAVPGSFLGGFMTDRIGARKTILATLMVWIATICMLMASQSKESFYFVSAMVGIGLGSTQGAARALFAKFVPTGQEAQFFALKGICGKAGTVLGPLTFGMASYLASSQRFAAGTLIIFFVIGFILVYGVNESEGIRQGRHHYEKIAHY